MNAVGIPQPYQLSFTSGALHLHGAVIAATLYRDSSDWAAVRDALRDGNLLQARTGATSTRWARELTQRLEMLTDDEIAVVADAMGDELSQLVWVATCRKYTLIAEFAEEVLRERFLLMRESVTHEHFDSFMSSKQLWHDELASVAPTTYRKLRSNVFAMLREAGLISREGIILPTLLADRVKPLLMSRVPSDIRFFPAREAA